MNDALSRRGQSTYYPADLTDPLSIKRLADNVINYYDSPEMIIYYAGGSFGKRESLLDWNDFPERFHANIDGADKLNRLLLPTMPSNHRSYVTHVGSTTSKEAIASVWYVRDQMIAVRLPRLLGLAKEHSRRP